MTIPAKAIDQAAILGIVRPHTVIDDEQIINLLQIRDQVLDASIPGDVVECGVCNGGSAAALAAGLDDSARQFWLYDTFEGMPPAGPEDPLVARQLTGAFKGSIESVQQVFEQVDFSWRQVELCKGLFADTLPTKHPERIALLHIDADWYQSVLECLCTLYPLVMPGGAIVLDDFGWWEGARKAFYKFCELAHVQPLLERSGRGQAYWFKGRENYSKRAR